MNILQHISHLSIAINVALDMAIGLPFLALPTIVLLIIAKL